MFSLKNESHNSLIMTTVITYKKTCEILCHKDTVLGYRQGTLPKNKVLVSDTIFKNAQKGDTVSTDQLLEVFGHCDQDKAIDYILMHGDYHMSTNELRELKNVAYQKVIAYIKKNYLNPVGDREYTESTIIAALEQCRCKASIDYKRSGEANFRAIKNKLQGKLMLKPKPGSVPMTVFVSWRDHAKLYTQYKPYLQNETADKDGQGCYMNLLVPPKDVERISRLQT